MMTRNVNKWIVAMSLAVMAYAPMAAQTDTISTTPIKVSYEVPTLPSEHPGAEKLVLSREECIRIALTDNPTVKVADMEVKRVSYSNKETLAALFPEIDFNLAYQRSIRLQTINMSMGGQSQSIKMGMDNTWDMGFTAQMPIINPQLWKSISITRTQIEANLEAARSSRLNLVDQINKAYYSMLLAYASYDVVKQNYDIAVLNASIYEKKFAVGTASEYDVLRTSVQVKTIEPELLQAEIAVRQCQLSLKVLMGIDSDVEIEPNITLAGMQQDMYGYLLDVNRSLADNSSLRSLDIQTKMLNQTVDLKKFAYIPTIGAQFNLKWSALSNGSPFKNQTFNPYSNVALSLNVPLITWGSRYYGVKGAEVQAKEMALQRESLVNSLNMQVDLAIDNINKEVMQIKSSEEGVRQAEKAYTIMQKSFEIGAASYLNLRDSELAQTAARLAYYQAIYNYLVSTSELDLLLGRETVLESVGTPSSK